MKMHREHECSTLDDSSNNIEAFKFRFDILSTEYINEISTNDS